MKKSVLVLEVDMDSVGNETWFDKEVQYCFKSETSNVLPKVKIFPCYLL